MTNAVAPVANMTAATTVKECTYTTTGMWTQGWHDWHSFQRYLCKQSITAYLDLDILSSHLSSLIHIAIFFFMLSRWGYVSPFLYLFRLVMMNALLLYSCFVVLGLEINKILPVEYIRGIGLPWLWYNLVCNANSVIIFLLWYSMFWIIGFHNRKVVKAYSHM